MLELLIAVAIMGVLAAIAYPSYVNSVRESNRSDAKAGLSDAAQRMQRCYTLSNSFKECPALGTYSSPEGLYNIEVALAGGGAGFVATAKAAKAPQTKDTKCPTFTLNHLGEKTPNPATDTNGCW